MSDKFQHKYRIPSARKPGWNYAWTANYFITICSHQKQHFFGDIINGEMQLSEIGRIVESEWLKTPSIRPDMNLYLGAFVIMPNHFHAIITIGDNQYNDGTNCRDAMHHSRDAMHHSRDAMHRVSTETETEYKNAFIPQSKNLASIVRGFKSAVTISARTIHADFGWQTRFHDHIIRNSQSHDRIERYIINNPINWLDDELFSTQ